MQTDTSPSQLQALADATARIMVVIDETGSITLLSKLARERLDINLGTSLKKRLPGFWQQARRILDGSLATCEIPLQIAEREYLVGVNPLRENNQICGAVCVLVDGTQLDTMTRRLPSFQTLSRELDTIIDSSSDGLFVCDAAANVIRMNPASEKIHNLAAAEIVGRNMKELINSGFIDRSAALEASQSKERVSLLQDKDGHKLMSIATPVFGEKNELIRIVVSERDMTEIDNLQHELENLQGFKDGFREQMLAMQQVKLESQEIIARSPAMVRALQQAIKVSKAASSVLLLGESGAGKGLFADLIHKNSGRAEQPLIKINCGAIPESLIEAELFGYEKGAFTGAQDKGKPGHLELADGGTLFLDEIAELPLSAQVKLLHFLEDGNITRIGGTKSHQADVRVLAATHQDLEKLVEEEKFRLDLFYRLNVIPIHIPALRERQECIVPLIHHYLKHFGKEAGLNKKMTRAALNTLITYPYPGNVRELMNICERVVVMAETDLIDVADLPIHINPHAPKNQPSLSHIPAGTSLQKSLDQVEKELLEKACQLFSNQTEIARELQVNQSTVARKLKKYGLS
ncbi:MAG: sigma 54-interacting transcriptional regulator [Thermodesulfobacteriota bacterium]|nr:sigma 54-interacting transcriptional regulator [Thermodesulfobacteriota bacterium]